MFLLVGLVCLGCSGGPAPSPSVSPASPITPAAESSPSWPAHFSALKTGAALELVADDNSKIVIEGRVVRADATSIEIKWTEAGAPSTYPIPTTFNLRGARVVIDEASFGGTDDAAAGRTVSTVDGLTCYEEGPGPDASDCPDVCYGRVCFDDARGLVRADGTWGVDLLRATSPHCSESTGSFVCN